MSLTLLLVTAPPTSRLAFHALSLAQVMQEKNQPFQVFFYQDGVDVANAHLWRLDDELHPTHAWQNLGIPLPVCVSAALMRGVSDAENAARHQLNGQNLAEGFCLIGLGTLADAIDQATHVIQF